MAFRTEMVSFHVVFGYSILEIKNVKLFLMEIFSDVPR